MTSAISTAPFGGPEVPRSVVTEHSKQCRFKWNWWRTSHNFIIVWFQSDDQCAANDCNANILLWLVSFHVNAITSQNSCRTNTLLEPTNSGFLYGVHILTQWRSRRFNTNKFPAMCVVVVVVVVVVDVAISSNVCIVMMAPQSFYSEANMVSTQCWRVHSASGQPEFFQAWAAPANLLASASLAEVACATGRFAPAPEQQTTAQFVLMLLQFSLVFIFTCILCIAFVHHLCQISQSSQWAVFCVC